MDRLRIERLSEGVAATTVWRLLQKGLISPVGAACVAKRFTRLNCSVWDFWVYVESAVINRAAAFRTLEEVIKGGK